MCILNQTYLRKIDYSCLSSNRAMQLCTAPNVTPFNSIYGSSYIANNFF